MRQDRTRINDTHRHVDKRDDALHKHIVANGCIHLESRLGSCAYGVRWRFGGTGGQWIRCQQVEREGEE